MFPANVSYYIEAAQKHIIKLQQHEKASQNVQMIQQGNEGDKFWEMFSLGSNRAH